jgi:uncharacterized protein YbbK (DUF523 family)/uncharacterized protein YbgA (DUF1722 family)
MNRSSATSELGLGVSSCLLGKPVRFDGSHKLDRYITEGLGKVFTIVPVCPEVEIGMAVPRETIDLHGAPMSPRLIGNESGIDRTLEVNSWSSQRVRQQDVKQACGFILKSRSPTCGLKGVRIVGPTGRSTKRGQGLFAMALRRRYPLLPVVEEQELRDQSGRESFIVRLFAYRRLQAALSYQPTARKLVSFHRRETCLLDAHNRDKRSSMDQLLSQPQAIRPSTLRDKYVRQFMGALANRSTVAKNLKVMSAVYRILNKHAASTDLENCSLSMEAYRREECQLLKPLHALRQCSEICGIDELCEQSWLFPDERELFLRFEI